MLNTVARCPTRIVGYLLKAKHRLKPEIYTDLPIGWPTNSFTPIRLLARANGLWHDEC